MVYHLVLRDARILQRPDHGVPLVTMLDERAVGTSPEVRDGETLDVGQTTGPLAAD